MPLAIPADRTTTRRSCVPIFNERPRVARDLWAYSKILQGDGLTPSPCDTTLARRERVLNRRPTRFYRMPTDLEPREGAR